MSVMHGVSHIISFRACKSRIRCLGIAQLLQLMHSKSTRSSVCFLEQDQSQPSALWVTRKCQLAFRFFSPVPAKGQLLYLLPEDKYEPHFTIAVPEKSSFYTLCTYFFSAKKVPKQWRLRRKPFAQQQHKKTSTEKHSVRRFPSKKCMDKIDWARVRSQTGLTADTILQVTPFRACNFVKIHISQTYNAGRARENWSTKLRGIVFF